MLKDSFKTTFHRCVLIGEDGSMDYDFIRLAKKQKKLTLLIKFLKPYVPIWYETPFEEIRITYPHERIQNEYKRLLNKQPVYSGTIEQFTRSMVNAIKKYLLVNMKDDEKYLMLHSGGYDSRIISSCFRDLWNDGKRYDIHFRCHQPEVPMFLEIMKREGWSSSYYSAWKGKKENYYDIGKDTMNGWQKYNQSMNFWSDIIPREKEKDYILMTGLGGELFKYIAVHSKDPCPKRSNNNHLDMILQFHPDEGQWEGFWMKRFKDYLMPKWGYYYIEQSFKVNPAWCTFNGQTDSIRIEMTKRFNYGITDIPYGTHNYSWNLTDKFFQDITEKFYASRFYKDWGKLITKPDFTKLYKWDAYLWGFMTTYDAIYEQTKAV